MPVYFACREGFLGKYWRSSKKTTWSAGVAFAATLTLLWGLAPPSDAATETVVYSFNGGGGDGSTPLAGLINIDGTMYGTTLYGGPGGHGSVFSITPGGTEKMLHSFDNGSGGGEPGARLRNINGTLYGTTIYGGGQAFCGTVFSMTLNGTETVLHSFDDGSDGCYPNAGLTGVKGTLYGTTANGGSYKSGYNQGTVFSITADGTETVLHAFGNGNDGAFPYSGLTNVNGKLYGTTTQGGAYHGGTVFWISPRGSERVLHSFGSGSDGSDPNASLKYVNGIFYGTTNEGGAHNGGTVFAITPDGAEMVLHAFGNGSDGHSPSANLIDVNGTLYGTTELGGTYGSGTVFSITPDGTERVLHAFGNGSDGALPYASLKYVNGTLFGTTYEGGKDGSGTVFSIVR
jgi:uncharacterized repeat protein (TIGR03803 family)